MPLLGTSGAASARGFGFGAVAGITAYLANYVSTSNSYNKGTSAGIDSTGNAYITSTQYYCGTYLAMTKYDSKGVLQYARRIATPAISGIATIDSSANIYTVCTNSPYMYLQKIDTGFSSVTWGQRIAGSTCCYFYQDTSIVKVDSSGNVYAASKFIDNFAGYGVGIALFKYNSSGTLQWKKHYYGSLVGSEPQFNGPLGLATDGSFVYVGGTCNFGGYYVPLIMKIDASTGTISWSKRLEGDGASNGAYMSVTTDGSGNVYACGYINASVGVIVKYDSTGAVTWQKSVSDGNYTWLQSIALDTTGNVFVTGQKSSNLFIPVIKLNSSGTVQWQRQWSCSTRYLYGLSIAMSGANPVVAGYSTNTSSTDYRQNSFQLPGDGSKSGSYSLSGSTYVYGTNTLSVSTSSYTSNNSTPTTVNANATGSSFSVTFTTDDGTNTTTTM